MNAVQQLASRSAEVLEALSDAIIVLDSDARIELYNSAAGHVLPSLSTGLRLDEAAPDFATNFQDYIRRAYGGSSESVARHFFRLADGVHFFNLRFQALSGNNGSAGGVMVVMTDITSETLEASQVQDVYTEIESELRTARKYQEALFTSKFDDAILSCRAFGQPAFELSGDFFELGKVGENYLFVLGDVQSHGIEVAIKAIALQHLCRVNVTQSTSISELMQAMNRFVFHDHQGAFWSCCLFMGLFDPVSRRLRYARAGTPEPLCFHPDGSVEMLSVGDTPLGFFEEELYSEGQIVIDPGSRLLIFSDGVTESAPLEAPMDCFGQDRLIMSYQEQMQRGAPGHYCDQIVEAVTGFHGSRQFNDDFTIAELLFK